MEIAIIGAGASGLAAALAAADRPENHVTLFERQKRVGRKLLASGNGRCNLCNTAASVKAYHGERPEFTAAALDRWPPAKVLDFFSGLGLMTVEEYGGRVFPQSGYAGSVLDVLRLELERRGVELRTGIQISALRREDGAFTLSWTEGSCQADRVIVACGGCAGGRLGGVGDGYALLRSMGHSVTALYPALTFLFTAPAYPRALKGIRTDAAITLTLGGRQLAEEHGDLLFTETGLSGTAIFALSRWAASCPGSGVSFGQTALPGNGFPVRPGLSVSMDFFPNRARDELAEDLRDRRRRWGQRPANRLLTGTVHPRLGLMLCKSAGFGGGVLAEALSDGELDRLLQEMKQFTLPVTGAGGFDMAQVTAGGVRTGEFRPDTMESRLVPGLYACGEVLDIDGDCGGFNLQWAWASGLTAGGQQCS